MDIRKPANPSRTLASLDEVPLDGSTVKVMTGSWASDADDGPDVPDRVHCLTQVEGPDAGRRIVVEPQGLTIGRSEPAEVVLADPQISRSHCRLELRGARLFVVDLNSTNGTFVQGARVTGQVELSLGSGLRVGKFGFRHEYRSRKAIEDGNAQWMRERTQRQEASQIQIEIDQVKRQQEVEKITGSEFFQSLTEELDHLRPD